jgi:Na+-driven multidrug efflux pump
MSWEGFGVFSSQFCSRLTSCHSLGERNYGIWAAFTVFIGSSNLLDLGLGSSILKFISEYYAQKDFEKINKAIFSGIIFYGLFGFTLIASGLIFRHPLLEFFRISDASNAYVMALIRVCHPEHWCNGSGCIQGNSTDG